MVSRRGGSWTFRGAGLLTLALLVSGTSRAEGPPGEIARYFAPGTELAPEDGHYKPPLTFNDGRPVESVEDWRTRRGEILQAWHATMGPWPPLLDRPRLENLKRVEKEQFSERRVRLDVAPDRKVEGYLLVPDGPGPFPAMLVVFYEPETAIGRGKTTLNFAEQLVVRGFVTLSIGFDPRVIDNDRSGHTLQPLSYLAYVAANAGNALAACPEVDPKRVGVMGHSYGGKWAMFASCLHEPFACGVWSDPGIVFDESRPNVNYWDPWYLGWEPGGARPKGVPSAARLPRRGAYKKLFEEGHDLHELHALMAPRPFLVSGGSEDPPERWRALNSTIAVNRLLGVSNRVAMTNRPNHTPTQESNEQICRFLEYVLNPARGTGKTGR
ncbi:MAG: prolyl oligopeptidase family serine peptidase [Isosphaeraceae bacterium]